MKQNISNIHRIYGLCCLLALLFAYSYAEAAEPVLNYSTNANRSAPNTLEGSTPNGLIYVTLPNLKSETITLSWNPNPDIVDGYRIYQGLTPLTTVNKFGSDITTTSKSFLDTEFNLDNTLQACFRLKAFNGDGESGFSGSVCTIINRVESVTFDLDGKKIRTENTPPYDLVGATTNGDALPLDVSILSDGQHTVTATITFKQQTKTIKVSGVFNTIKKLQPPTGVAVRSELVW